MAAQANNSEKKQAIASAIDTVNSQIQCYNNALEVLRNPDAFSMHLVVWEGSSISFGVALSIDDNYVNQDVRGLVETHIFLLSASLDRLKSELVELGISNS